MHREVEVRGPYAECRHSTRRSEYNQVFMCDVPPLFPITLFTAIPSLHPLRSLVIKFLEKLQNTNKKVKMLKTKTHEEAWSVLMAAVGLTVFFKEPSVKRGAKRQLNAQPFLVLSCSYKMTVVPGAGCCGWLRQRCRRTGAAVCPPPPEEQANGSITGMAQRNGKRPRPSASSLDAVNMS
jgi:hypothetical protein